LSRPFGNKRRRQQRGPFIRTNGKIRAREVRVVGPDGSQIGVLPTPEAIQLARRYGVDLVEVAANASPPVCRIIDYGKYRYELSKKEKEAKKHQHSNKTKEIQLRPSIDSHDFSIKLNHAIDFLCEDMKVKVSLRFRGREMAHKEFGFQTIKRFLTECAPYGTADAPPKLVGRGIGMMVSPLPKNKRAPNPRGQVDIEETEAAHTQHESKDAHQEDDSAAPSAPAEKTEKVKKEGTGTDSQNTPADNVDSKVKA